MRQIEKRPKYEKNMDLIWGQLNHVESEWERWLKFLPYLQTLSSFNDIRNAIDGVVVLQYLKVVQNLLHVLFPILQRFNSSKSNENTYKCTLEFSVYIVMHIIMNEAKESKRVR